MKLNMGCTMENKYETNAKIFKVLSDPNRLMIIEMLQSRERCACEILEDLNISLPRLRNADETEVIIVTLAEATPVYEAMRLEEDLKRAGIATKWWVINSSLYHTGTTNQLLSAKASNEIEWINKVDKHSNGDFAVIAWSAAEIKGDELLTL